MKYNNTSQNVGDTYTLKEREETMLFTVKEVSDILKTNVDYVHKLRKSGLLKFLKLGQYKVRKETLVSFLKNCEGKDLTNPFDVKEII